MKRIFLYILAAIVCLPIHAVLKERDLHHTLGILRLELERNYNEQKTFLATYEAMSRRQHSQLVDFIKKSEQIGLIMYSQRTDFTFDVAYACQQATDLYHALSANNLPYDMVRERIEAEVARYDSLIHMLESLPPMIGEARRNSPRHQALDSLYAASQFAEKTEEKHKAETYMLNQEDQANRQKCYEYAIALRKNLKEFLSDLTRDNDFYQEASSRVNELYGYSQKRYSDLQKNIFSNGGDNYIKVLSRLPEEIARVKRDFEDKYLPLRKDEKKSQWRGFVVLGVSIFMLFYILIAYIVSLAFVRGVPWLMKRLTKKTYDRIHQKIEHKFIGGEELHRKRNILTLAVAIGTFALAITIVRGFLMNNLFIMATDMMITLAWLMEAVVISLMIRLNGTQVYKGLLLYLPFISMAFIVVVFRIVLMPNSIVNICYPPILLIFVFWQLASMRRSKNAVPVSDSLYASISLLTMIVGCTLAWVGFSLLAVQIMVWWTFQLAAIQTITCLYDLIGLYEHRVLVMRILQDDAAPSEEKEKDLIKRMRMGEFFNSTWLYDLIRMAILPAVAVYSFFLCIYLAADLFDMTSVVQNVFFKVFIDQPGVVQLSLHKISLVSSCYFVFRYLNYAIRSYYHLWYRRMKKDTGNFNETLTRNIIAILVWGSFCIFALMLLQVPRSGISIVLTGLMTGMGFAMKDLLENFFYGISLMSGRLRVGDFIECDGIQGKVESITYQSTQIVTTDGSVMAFLNSALFNKNFKNYTRNHGYTLQKVELGIAYGADIKQVRDIIMEALQPLTKERVSNVRLVEKNKPFTVHFSDFGDSSVKLNIYAWVLVDQKAAFLSQARELIYKALNSNGIEIPFPQQDIHIRQAIEN